MLVYIIAILAIALIMFVASRIQKAKYVGLSLSFFILWLVASFRTISVGNDTGSYVDFFSNVSSGSIDVFERIDFSSIFSFEGFENGFKLYNYLLASLTNNYTEFFMITYAIIFYSFYRLIKKYSKDIFLSTILYICIFFFGSMSSLRQSLAMAILSWGIKYIEQRSFFRYLAIVLLATLIHQSSIVMVVPYFLYNNKLSVKTIAVFAILVAGAFLLIESAILLLASENIRYSFYIDRIGSYSLGSFLSLSLYSVITVFMYVIYKRGKKTSDDSGTQSGRVFSLKMMGLTLGSSIIALKVNALSRFAQFFMIYALISIPNFIQENKNIRRMNTYRVVLILTLIIYTFALLILKPEWLGVTEYKSVIGVG